MSDTQETFDISQLESIAEMVDPNEVVETEDYFNKSVIPVGKYLSTQRDIVGVKHKADGSVTVTLALTGGIQKPDNGGFTYGGGQFPLKAYLSTKLFSFSDRPGKTSGLAQYLRACGLEPKGMSVKDMLTIVPQTLATPVVVKIEWSDKGEKQADGSYTNLKLKSRDFITGRTENGDPVFSPQIVVDGRTVEAVAKVGGFSELK